MSKISRRDFLKLSSSTAAFSVFDTIFQPPFNELATSHLIMQQNIGAIEGYASATSISPGESIIFHVNGAFPHYFFHIDIYRKGKEEILIHSGTGTTSTYFTPANAYEVGCGWPPAYGIVVPDDWSSGVYVARVTSFSGDVPLGATTDILFVVKATAPSTNSKILFQLTVTTYEAYNPWGGGSLYSDPPARKVSFDRPGYYAHFYLWELPFISWLENNGFEVEYCTSVDLHAESDFLNNYQLLLSVGHDEYWSKEMRDNIEAYIANGGNAAFFSGNVCWWQIRFEDNNRTMVCYKDNDLSLPNRDPLRGIDDSRVTVTWGEYPVNRPENYMTGVSFRNGAGWWTDAQTAGRIRPPTGYQVRLSQHWVFDSTGLNDGSEFGAADSIVGYETDAALYREVSAMAAINNKLFATTKDNKLWWRDAVGENVDWEEIGHSNYIKAMTTANDKLFAVTWRDELLWRDPVGDDIEWEEIGHANNVVQIAAISNKLFAATWDNKLWWRDPVGEDVAWEEIGHANDVVAMTAMNEKLFVATKDNKLWWRDPVGEDVAWEEIGHANDVVAMAAINEKLFVATKDNKLLWRDPVGEDISWEEIGLACKGFLEVSGEDGTPLNFLVLATADLTDWVRGGQAGLATMGIYRNNGSVFTAATTDWPSGLIGNWNALQQITQNVLRRLSHPQPVSPHIPNSSFEKWLDPSQPDDWIWEGAGSLHSDETAAKSGQYGLVVDATQGQTWTSYESFTCEGRNYYRVGCWAKASQAGATIRLQSMDTFHDFAIAEHSGGGEWEYLNAVGMIDDGGPLFPARVKIQVADGVIAAFDNVVVESL